MKQLFLFIALFTCINAASAQIKTDANGNYIATQRSKDTTKGGTPTGHTFTDSKGKVWSASFITA